MWFLSFSDTLRYDRLVTKRNERRNGFFPLLLLLVFTFMLSCVGGGGSSGNGGGGSSSGGIDPIPDDYVYVSGISIDGDSSLVLLPGQSITLNANVTPSNATALSTRKVTWDSTDIYCVKPDWKGKFTIPTQHNETCIDKTFIITATIKDRSPKMNVVDRKATVSVTVVKKVIAVSGVTVSPPKKTLSVGQSVRLYKTILPNLATNRNVSWSSSNSGIASVDSKGNVTAVANGTANITVTTEDGNKTAVSKITVAQPVAVQSISITPATAEVFPSTETLPSTFQLSVKVLPANATYGMVAWSSSDMDIAQVDSLTGLVKGIWPGSATITVEVGDKTATAKVTVKNPFSNPPPASVQGIRFPMGDKDQYEGVMTRSVELHQTEIPYALWARVSDWAYTKGGYSERFSASEGGKVGVVPTVGTDPPTAKGKHPATAMTWYEAALWCNAYTEWSNYALNTNYTVVYRDGATPNEGNPIRDLNVMKEKLKDFNDPDSLTGTGWRLPTEVEWEFTARYMGKASNGCPSYTMEYKGNCFLKANYISSAKTAHDDCFPELPNGELKCNVNNNKAAVLGWDYEVFVNNDGRKILDIKDSSLNETDEVDSRTIKNYLNIYDMGGNVKEWCFDMYPLHVGKTNLGTQKRRKVRGSSFNAAKPKMATVGYCSREYYCFYKPKNSYVYNMIDIGLRPARTTP